MTGFNMITLMLFATVLNGVISELTSSNANATTGKTAESQVICGRGRCCSGVPGIPGKNGMPGRPGAMGPSGPPGRNGLNGIPGSRGSRGEPGQEGRRGRKGPPGLDGKNGTNGAPGWRGKEGRRGAMGPIGPSGPSGPPGLVGKPGRRGERGPPGRVARHCRCQRNVPTQMFFINSGFWISHKHMLGFQNVPFAAGRFHVKVAEPVTYVLHIGGDWVNDDSVTLYLRLHCSHRRRVVYLPNEAGHRIYKFKTEYRLESETFTYVTTSLSHTGRWKCQLQLSKGYMQATYRWDSQYGELSLVMW